MNIEKSSGAVLFTEVHGTRYYVLVSSTVEHNCGLPKGHIENGETNEETALREIMEETCIKAELIQGFREQTEYTMPNGVKKQVVYLLARYQNQEAKKNPAENLNVMCLQIDEALKALTFEETKNVLRKADDWIDTHIK